MYFQTYDPTYSTRLIHVFFKFLARLIPDFSIFWPDLFHKAYSCFFKLLARLIPQDLFMFFQTLAWLIHVFSNFWPDLFTFYQKWPVSSDLCCIKKKSREQYMLPFDFFSRRRGFRYKIGFFKNYNGFSVGKDIFSLSHNVQLKIVIYTIFYIYK